MNIVELSEKNLFEAVSLFRVAKGSFYEALGQDPSDVDVRKMLLEDDPNSFSYMLSDKGVFGGLVTVNKPQAEIKNLWLNYDLLEEGAFQKLMEFAIKQFSAITLVYFWIDSVDGKLAEVLEDYGFEYTGEQDYVDKEKNLLKFKYMFKRKK